VNPYTSKSRALAEVGYGIRNIEYERLLARGGLIVNIFGGQNDESGIITRGCAQRTHN